MSDIYKDLIKQIQTEKDFTIHIKETYDPYRESLMKLESNDKIKANITALKATSGYFRGYFSCDKNEYDKHNVTFDKNADIMNKMVDFIHNVPITINHNEIIPLVSESNYFDIPTLETYLRKEYKKHVNKDTVYYLYTESKKLPKEINFYKDYCFDFIVMNLFKIEELVKTITDFDDFANFITHIYKNCDVPEEELSEAYCDVAQIEFVKKIDIWIGDKNLEYKDFMRKTINLDNITLYDMALYSDIFSKYYSLEEIVKAYKDNILTDVIRINDCWDDSDEDEIVESITVNMYNKKKKSRKHITKDNYALVYYK